MRDGSSVPMGLSHEWPRMAVEAKERIKACLATGCSMCHGVTARLTQRLSKGAVTVWLQCDTCGRCVSNAMRRADHPLFQDYPKFDEGLAEQWWRQRTLADDEFGWLENKRHEAQQERLSLSDEYADWLATSTEWADLSARVLRHRGLICEACLGARSSVVHHLTYKRGWLPPAWELKAVCRKCHERLHANKHERQDNWCLEAVKGSAC